MKIKVERVWIIVAVVAFSTIMLGLAGTLPTYSQTEDDPGPRTVTGAVGEGFTYQGRLTDDDGAPLDGTYEMRFLLYYDPVGGDDQYDSGPMNVAVDGGLFIVDLDAPQSVFDGEELWLEIHVEGEFLSPRQGIKPAPYALGLRPGAVVRNAATGTALRLESQDVALYGTGQNFGVYGLNEGSANGSGYGGYFTSTTGIGIFGGSSAVPSTTNPYVPGVHGHSERGAGVYGTSDSFFGYGVFGEQPGTGIGTYGQAATGYGVLGTSDGVGVYGAGEAQGVYGTNNGPAEGTGYGGYFESSTGVGVYGSSTAVPSTTNSLPAGVYGYSENGAGVYGEAGSQFSLSGYFSGNVSIDGSLIVSDSIFANDKSGYVLDLALNDGDGALERGDVVVVSGVADPVIGDIPVPLVHRAQSEASSGVIGVVDRRYVADEAGAGGRMEEGPVAPGQYAGVVTLGAFQAIKVDAAYGAIRPGDLLVSSPTPGHAMHAEDPGVGTVIGKAMEAVDEGTGVIAVMITMQ